MNNRSVIDVAATQSLSLGRRPKPNWNYQLCERNVVQFGRAKRRSAAVHDVPISQEHAFHSHTGRGYREVMSGDDLQIRKILILAFLKQQTIIFNAIDFLGVICVIQAK